MWVLFAFGSAMLAGLTSVLAKCGIKKADSTVATAIRTIVVLIFSWLMVFVVGSQETISAIGGRTLLFLVLSGLATGASWLCYFKALQLGDVNKVVPIDKSSTVLTILLAAIFLQEGVSLTKGIGVVLIAVGTFLMIEKKQSGGETKSAAWLWYALGSAVFASLTAKSASPAWSPIWGRLSAPVWCFLCRGSWCLSPASRERLRQSPKTSCFSFASRVLPPAAAGCATTRPCKTALPAWWYLSTS